MPAENDREISVGGIVRGEYVQGDMSYTLDIHLVWVTKFTRNMCRINPWYR